MFFKAHNLSLLIEGEQVMLFLFLGKFKPGNSQRKLLIFYRAGETQAQNKNFQQDQYGV
jgi:hypothetical protein